MLDNFKDPWEDLKTYTNQRGELLKLNKDFQHKVKAIRSSFNIPIDTGFDNIFKTIEIRDWWKQEQTPRFKEFDDCISAILTGAKLLSGWRPTIETYVLTNEMYPPPCLMVEDTLDKYGNLELKIIVNDYSNMKQLKYAHKFLLAWRSHIGLQRPGQINQPIRKFKQYIALLKLQNDHKSEEIIATEMNDLFDDVAYTKKSVHDDLAYINKMIDSQMS